MRTLITAIALSFQSTATLADTINVPYDQPIIASAINASVDGDVINILAGTYNEHSLNTGTKSITIQGTLNADGSLATTSDAQQGGTVLEIDTDEDEIIATVIKDLVITGGSAGFGGGIICSNTNITITNCIISNNTATILGGGIYCRDSWATQEFAADINGDGEVNGKDLAFVIGEWGVCP